jgi:hypothetical protein
MQEITNGHADAQARAPAWLRPVALPSTATIEPRIPTRVELDSDPRVTKTARRVAEESQPGRSKIITPTGSGLALVALRKQQRAKAADQPPTFVETTKEVARLAKMVRRGKIDDRTLEARLASLPKPSDAEYTALWTKECSSERRKLEAAFDQLADLRPNVVLYRGQPNAEQTLRESSLYSHVAEANYYPSNSEELARAAKAFLAECPDSPRAAWVKALLEKAV